MSTHSAHCRRFGVQVLTPALVLLMLLGAGCSEKESTPSQAVAPAPQTAEPGAPPPAETPQPATEPEAPQAAAGSQAATVDGQKIYQASCQACHAVGVAGAPKLGDKQAWAPRIAKGNDALFSSVRNGLNAMPPKGGCMSCSEDELRAAIGYMVGQGS